MSSTTTPTGRLDGRSTVRTLVLWAAMGGLPRFYGDVLDVWRPWAPAVEGRAIDASHFLAEDRPEEIARELLTFLTVPDPEVRTP